MKNTNHEIFISRNSAMRDSHQKNQPDVQNINKSSFNEFFENTSHFFKVNKWLKQCKQYKDPQSFTSLMADLRQDINRVSSFGRYLNGTFS